MSVVTQGHAFVTGGAGGIGFAIASELAAAGMTVTLADLDPQRLATAVASGGAAMRGEVLDVTDEASWIRATASAEAASGPISILVNSAGTGGGGTVGSDDPRSWKLVMEINAFGSFLGANLLVPRMLASGEPCHIVNIASLSGLYAQPGMSAYNASKHALVGLSDTLRLELANTQVGVSIVYPGAVNTGFITNRADIIEQKLGIRKAGGADLSAVLASGMDPQALARIVVNGIREKAYHIHTHGGWRAVLEVHFADKLEGYGDESRFAESQDLALLHAAINREPEPGQE